MKKVVFVVFLFSLLFCYADPDWEIVIYTNSTVAYCQIMIDEIHANEGDLIGAFVEGECRGIGNTVVFEGNSYSTLNIQGNIPEIVSFQVWDQSIDTICAVEYTTLSSPGYDIGYPPDYLPINAYSGNPINHYPEMELPEALTLPEDVPTTYDFSEFCWDIDGDQLSIEAEDNDDVSCETNGLLVTLTSAENWFGISSLTFWLSDGSLMVHDSLDIYVTYVNDPPQITDTYPEAGYIEIEQFEPANFAVIAEDVDSAIQYEWFLDSQQLAGIDYFIEHTFMELGNCVLECVVSDEEYNVNVSWDVNVVVNPVTDEDISPASHFRIAPNPCHEMLNISWDQQRNSVKSICIYDLRGRLLKKSEIQRSSGSYSIDDLENFAAGIYFLRVNSANSEKLLKFTVR